MRNAKTLAFGAALVASGALAFGASATSAEAAGQEDRGVLENLPGRTLEKADDAAIKKIIEAAGDTYISADAQGSAAKQASDIEGLIAQKVDVILVVAYDSDAILPSIKAANDAGVKMIAYDVQFEDPNSLYITFDNIGVGRLMAKEVLKAKPAGNYAFIKGDKGDPNATFLFSGITEVLKPAMDAGKIKNVCETFTDGWKPDNAQKNMEQCLTKQNNKVDAVVAENDGMASGVVAALKAQGMDGQVPVSGQDGDLAAINRVALGTQTVSIWKDSRDARQSRRRGRDRHRRWQEDHRSSRRHKVQQGEEGSDDELHPASSRSDHQGQPRRRDRHRLDQQG